MGHDDLYLIIRTIIWGAIFLMADDIKNVLIDNWDITMIALGTIEYQHLQPEEEIGNGISIVPIQGNYDAYGFTMQQTGAFGGDQYLVSFIDESEANVKLRLKAAIEVCQTFNTNGGNTTYDKMYPQTNNIMWDRGSDENPLPPDRKIARMYIQMTLNNKNLFT